MDLKLFKTKLRMPECLLIWSRTIVVFVVVEVLVVHLFNCPCLRALNLLLCALLSKQIKNDIISVFYDFIIGLTIRSLLTLISKLCVVGGPLFGNACDGHSSYDLYCPYCVSAVAYRRFRNAKLTNRRILQNHPERIIVKYTRRTWYRTWKQQNKKLQP